LLSQDRHAERLDFVDATADWDGGSLSVRRLDAPRAPGSCTVYRPDIGSLLPVYVADRYEGIEARTFADCSAAEIEAYLKANVAAVAELRERVSPELALANHLVMGPAILARGLSGEVPYAVKVHGSALEYTVKPCPERFLEPAVEGLRGAAAVLVGSRHTAESLWQALGDRDLPRRTRLGPPGVDVARFAPREPAEAGARLRALAAQLRSAGTGRAGGTPPGADAAGSPAEEPASTFARDSGAAGEALARVDPEHERIVAFVGKLIVSKGVDLLLACWPLVLQREPRARLVIVGFGAYRDALEALSGALAAGDLVEVGRIARAGRSLESTDTPAVPLRYLLSFLEALEGDARAAYVKAAAALGERVVFTGRLEHEELTEVLPACEAVVMPSTFPEAFGMVAAEGAACAALPVSAAHSGLAEVSTVLAAEIPAKAAAWLSFDLGERAVPDLASCLTGWLGAPPPLREAARQGLVRTVGERWSWEGVARGVIAAARGELTGLAEP
ncbi:MAG TPA: glycosyltransferase, partial [Solirubrobacteraceae bacterium]|nr:glycosyltransferase [Solirubrobacteraceae bacterium]